jgi:hypothetical protein
MPSELKSATARANGAKSRGPTTPQGRATSSMNALSHGLTAKTLILPHENQDLFLEMFTAYFDLFRPANQMEIDVVSDIVANRWRLRRTWRYQTAILDVEMATHAPEFEKCHEQFDEDMRGVLAFLALANNSRGYDTALRTDIHLTRTYRKALDELRRLRGGNILNKIPVLQNEPEDPNLTTMDATPAAKKISTEPSEPSAPPDSPPDILHPGYRPATAPSVSTGDRIHPIIPINVDPEASLKPAPR